MEINSPNPKITQDQIAKEFGCSSSFYNDIETTQKYFHFIESQQIVMKRDKRFQVNTSMKIQIVKMASKDLQ